MKYIALVFVFVICFAGAYFLSLPPAPPKRATLYWWPEGIGKTAQSWFIPLQQEFLRHGYLLETQDKHPIDKSDLIIFAQPNFPQHLPTDKKLYAWGWESPLYLNQPLSPRNTPHFKKIFTFRRDLVDNQKTFYLPCGILLHPALPPSPKTILVAQVATNNKMPSYEERRTAIRWFVTHHPEDLHFYGSYWETLRRDLTPEQQAAFDSAYKGYAKDKYQTLSQARFTLAYENVNANDYVSEKIYDALLSDSVPIYLGAPNITDYVPADCFINKNDFPSYEVLYDYIKNMPEEQYQKYKTCAQKFLASPAGQKLTGHARAKQLADEIFN